MQFDRYGVDERVDILRRRVMQNLRSYAAGRAALETNADCVAQAGIRVESGCTVGRLQASARLQSRGDAGRSRRGRLQEL